jgi:formate hydrogenlyase subunit 3/multisubunit Na+/H+ antiporter MnhD subunit
MSEFVAIAGWCGALIILLAYGLLSTGTLESRSAAYQLLNVVGAIGIAINSGWNNALPSAVLNVVWAAIAIYALATAHRQRLDLQ